MPAGASIFVTVDRAYISRARNYFAHLVLREPRFTHLVMIDSDLSFEGHVICRLLRCDKPVVAAAYSQRRMNMVAFAESARNPELALTGLTAVALEYNLQPELEAGTRQVKLIDGMCGVNYVALGCAAIRRDAFESMNRGRDCSANGATASCRKAGSGDLFTIPLARPRSRMVTASAHPTLKRLLQGKA